MSSTASSRPPPARILVRGVNWLGDAVMTTPALQRLREHFPDAQILLLTPAKLAELWTGHPAVDAVLTFEPGESALAVGSRLKAEKFDLGLALPNSTRSALELWLAGIPERVGYAGGGRRLMLTHAVPRRGHVTTMRKRSAAEVKRLIAQPQLVATAPHPQTAHHLFHYLHLVAALGCRAEAFPPSVAVSDRELKAMDGRLGLLEVESAKVPLFGLNPGAEYGPAKRWPRERFVAAALELHRRTGCRWVILGGKGDTELAAGIAAQIQHGIKRQQAKLGELRTPAVLNLAGQTSLRELCAALKACDVVLTNDTGTWRPPWARRWSCRSGARRRS
jgi:heptosyltransferase II